MAPTVTAGALKGAIFAANVYEKLGNKAAAMKVYEQIKKQYPTSQQAATVDALIERAK